MFNLSEINIFFFNLNNLNQKSFDDKLLFYVGIFNFVKI